MRPQRSGFEPKVSGTRRDVEVNLLHCPFADVATDDTATICQLHLGLAEGAAEALGGVEVVGLELRDPVTAGCVLRLRRPEA